MKIVRRGAPAARPVPSGGPGFCAMPSGPHVYSNTQLPKDRGVIPYAFYRELGCRVVLVSANNGDYPNLQQYLEGVSLDFVSPRPAAEIPIDEFVSLCLSYIDRHCGDMDILFLFGAYPAYIPMVERYKRRRPDGRI